MGSHRRAPLAKLNCLAGDVAIEIEGLRKSYGDVEALCGIDLEVETGHRARPARPERRREDDRGADPDHAAAARRRQRPGRRPRRGRRRGRAARPDRPRRPVRRRRREPDRLREPRDGRPPLPPRQAAARASARPSCSSASTSPRRATGSAKTYSGGMRRRLDLAAALVARPPVLFLDEPTTGLDPRSRLGLWEMIEARVAQGTTVLLTTQYLDEADRLADRIAVIDHGTRDRRGHVRRAQGAGRRRAARGQARGRAEQCGAAIAALAALAAEAPSSEDGTVDRPGARAPRRDRRGGAPARRRGDRDRRHRGPPPDARRRLPDADRQAAGAGRGRRGRAAEPRPASTRSSRHDRSLRDQRHAGARDAAACGGSRASPTC